MISVFDLHKLTSEQRRLHDLEILVSHRRMIGYQTAPELYQILTERGFDYTLDEIHTELNKEKVNGRNG